jgi:hypothetical protein
LGSGDNKHVTHEESVICACAYHSNSDAVCGVPASVSIDNIKFSSGVEVALGNRLDDLERRGLERFVDITPCDVLFSNRIFNNRFGSRHSSKSKKRYPVLRPEKATKAPVLEILFGCVSGSAGANPSPLS